MSRKRNIVKGFEGESTTKTLDLKSELGVSEGWQGAPRGFLLVMRGRGTGSVHRVADGLVVGRGKEANLRFPDPGLSREHARIAADEQGAFFVQDLGSRNGTWVGNDRIDRRSLSSGDVIQVGQNVALRFVFQDEVDQQLLDAQKMEAVGSLAGGIAHDFNNLLAVIEGGAGYFKAVLDKHGLHKVDGGDELDEVVTDMRAAVQTAAGLTRQLLDFARHGKFEQSVVDVGEMVYKAIRMVRLGLDRRISVDMDCEKNLAVVGDASRLQQLLLNLLINAREAMPEGGRVSIKARSLPARGPGGPDGKGIRMMELCVSDEGEGMDEATRARAFEPFYSTKSVGTGLGLAMVYAIARHHGGEVEIESQQGQGTTFRIQLPLADEQPDADTIEVPPGDTAAYMMSGTVLVVDDEPRVRRSLVRLVRSLGYTVLEAEDGQAALEVFDQNAEEIGLVILDLVMPRMGGEQAFEKLRERSPRLKVVISSGYDAGHAENLMGRPGLVFLHKPYDADKLKAAIRKVTSFG